jgi:hypothetical protein
MMPMLPGWKDVLRNARDGGAASAWECLASGRIQCHLRHQRDPRKPEPVEVHILSGGTRLNMALWMMASLEAASHKDWNFVIHDDGSLRKKDADLLQKMMPGCRVILSAESTPKGDALLKGHPLCLQCRNLHPFGRRLFDFPLFASGDRFFSFDTDVLFFSRPARLIQWMSDPQPSCLFMEDIEDNNLLSETETRGLCGRPPIGKINAGMMAIPKNALSLDLLEKCLRETSLLQRDSWFIEQTLFALAAAAFGRTELLDKSHVMSFVPACPLPAIARHYPGAIRHLFYSEGLPLVRKNFHRR